MLDYVKLQIRTSPIPWIGFMGTRGDVQAKTWCIKIDMYSLMLLRNGGMKCQLFLSIMSVSNSEHLYIVTADSVRLLILKYQFQSCLSMQNAPMGLSGVDEVRRLGMCGKRLPFTTCSWIKQKKTVLMNSGVYLIRTLPADNPLYTSNGETHSKFPEFHRIRFPSDVYLNTRLVGKWFPISSKQY